MKRYKCKIRINELLFAIYIFLFILTRIILKTFQSYSRIILFVVTFTILIISFIYNFKKDKKIKMDKTYLAVILIISCIYIVSKIVDNKSYINKYIYEFIIYGIITMYLYTKIESKRVTLKYMITISIFLVCLYFLEPFIGYKYTTGYMQFGFMCMLPAFCCIHLGRKVFNKKNLIIFEIISFIELLFFANRNSILTAIVFSIVVNIVTNNLNYKTIFKYILLFGFCILISINMGYIQENIFSKLNIKSYSFMQTYDTFVGIGNGLSGRDEIWKESINYIKEKPILGHGIASFNNHHGTHPHNIILEFLTSFGIIETIPLTIILIIGTIEIFKKKNSYEKFFDLYFMVIGLVPLQLNMYFSKWQYFWVFMLIITNLIKNKIKNGTIDVSWIKSDKFLTKLNETIKRTADIIISIIGILLLVPTTIIVKIINIINQEKGSIFYSQTRIGKNGKKFKIYKFRTMHIDADKMIEKILKENKDIEREWKEKRKIKNDPRITKVGKILRKFAIDETPQFINIFLRANECSRTKTCC